MRLLIIMMIFLFLSFCGQTDKGDKSTGTTTISDCDRIKADFNKQLKEITWDKDGEIEGNKLISDDFFNKYLKDIKEFKTRSGYEDLYYHSVPDIQTDKCLVIIKSVFKYDQYSYSYKLVDLGRKPKVVIELAVLEDYPDGQKRIKSIFLDDKSLRKTRVTEFIGDYDEKSDKYETINDSVSLTYHLKDNRFVLTKMDSIRTIKK